MSECTPHVSFARVGERPDLLNARKALGTLYFEQRHLEATVGFDPRSGYALYHLGETLISQKRFNAAITYLKQGRRE